VVLLCPLNALVQLQARYNHCDEVASEKCLSGATFVRRRAWRSFGEPSREAEPVPVWIGNYHFARSVRRILRRLGSQHATRYELAVASVDIWHHKVRSAADLAVAGVLSEEDGLARPRQLHKDRQARLEAVLPIDLKSEAANVKSYATLSVGYSKLWCDSLDHVFSSIRPPNALVELQAGW